MLARILSISLIAGMLFKPFMGLYMVMDYEMNKDYFAEYLCENKERPELECEGKCFLMQKLEKSFADRRSEHQHVLQHLTKIEIMDLPSISTIRFRNIESIRILFDILQNTSVGFLSSIFHPPILK